eukprot:jgi/Chrzof1/9747/Cz04g14110.t1
MVPSDDELMAEGEGGHPADGEGSFEQIFGLDEDGHEYEDMDDMEDADEATKHTEQHDLGTESPANPTSDHRAADDRCAQTYAVYS